MTVPRRAAGSGLLIAALFLIGCESGNKHLPAKLTGKVTYNGTPVGGGIIALHSADGQMYTTHLGTDGTFRFPSLPEGQLTATIETESVNPNKKQEVYRSAGAGGGMAGKYGKMAGAREAPNAPKKGAEPSPAPEGANVTQPNYVKIPAKYADKEKSGLSVTVKKGDQEHNFELTD